jgi:ABC-type multidrug transport system ATPase subunit
VARKTLTPSGERRFWGAKGTVSDFLALTYARAIAPHRVKRRVEVELGVQKTVEFLYLFVPDLVAFRQLAEGLSPTTLFKMLESTYISDVIHEVRIRVKIRGSHGTLTFRELSEGEQQLLVVLGLLRFTGEAESLFLLDEPDTHLNPSWAVKYLSFLRDFVPSRETSHIILATHNPLAIAELEKGQVQIMWRDENTGKVCASPPAYDPRGQGFGRILTSDMFGLESTLDEPTQELLRKRREIAEKPSLTDSDIDRLKDLNQKLGSLGYQFSSLDPDFEEFMEVRREVLSNTMKTKEPSNPEQVHARRKKAKDIVSKLLAEKEQE